MRTVQLPDGTVVPALGQGTWHMGERGRAAKNEVAALKLGIELGMTQWWTGSPAGRRSDHTGENR